jgi:tetratricopeptide (TPR) repeat protein
VRTDAARDADTIIRRPFYLTLVAEALLRHHKASDNADLAEARLLVDKLKPIQRDALISLMLEARIDKAANQLDVATKRFLEYAARADTTARLRAADAAEKIGLYDAAESIYRRTSDEPPPDRLGPPNRARLAIFLARHGKLKEAIDICEGLWADLAGRETIAIACVEMLCNPAVPVDETQVRRVVGWFELAREENPRSMPYLVGLGSLYDRLGDYPNAVEKYRTAIKINDRDGIASNNLAWLLAFNGGKAKADEAFTLIDHTIRVRGPQPEFLDTRGMIYLKLDDVTHAVGDLEQACKNAPSPAKYFHLAQAYLKQKDPVKARKTLMDGKTRGLPGGLHRLEVPEYNQLASELKMK